MKVFFFLSALFLATTNALEVSKGQIPPARAAFEAVMKNAKPETEEQANQRKPNAVGERLKSVAKPEVPRSRIQLSKEQIKEIDMKKMAVKSEIQRRNLAKKQAADSNSNSQPKESHNMQGFDKDLKKLIKQRKVQSGNPVKSTHNDVSKILQASPRKEALKTREIKSELRKKEEALVRRKMTVKNGEVRQITI